MARVLNKTTGQEHAVSEEHWSLTSPEYEVIDSPEAAPSLEDMTVTELREYATENSIDVGDASRKADIIEAIRGA